MTASEPNATTVAHPNGQPSVASGLTEAVAQRAGTTVITKHFHFDAAHFLPNVPEDHKCRRVHGHTYQVWIHVTGPLDEQAGWVVDFGDVKRAWKPIGKQLDHHLLNDVEGLENPTAENLAAWIWRQYEEERAQGTIAFSVAAVEVAETPDSRAMFVPPHRQPWVPGNTHVALDVKGRESEEATDSNRRRASSTTNQTAPSRGELEDVQSRVDARGVALHEVGVSRVRVPFAILDPDGSEKTTVAVVTLAVDLSAEVRGTHLSRFVQALRSHKGPQTLLTLRQLARELRQRLGSSHARVRVEFPYFVTKSAPVTGELGEIDVDCVLEVVDQTHGVDYQMQVTTPVTTVCPCSRDISDYGAHNQRGRVTIDIRCATDGSGNPSTVWIEELVSVAEAAASYPLFSVVKRPDERFVTMAGYDNAKFVEDVVRDAALSMRNDRRISDYQIRIENEESIHAHNAFAVVRSEHSKERH